LGFAPEPKVYDFLALNLALTTVRTALLCAALTLWVLYCHEALFRSRRIRVHSLKKGLADLLVVLSIALVTLLVFSLASGIHPIQHHSR
jgi:hypothetical protein